MKDFPVQNVLVTSISKKVPLLKAFKTALVRLNPSGVLFGGDLEEQCLGRYFVDYFWRMPRLCDIGIEDLINYCEQRNISAIVPTRDGELEFFSFHKNILEDAGIKVMVSGKDAVLTCLDKLKFYNDLRKYPIIPTAISLSDLDSAEGLVVKERYGAGSKSLGLNLNHSQAIKHAGILENPIFQPYILGKEISIDLYINKKGKTQGVISRYRTKVENGESQITQTLHHPELELICSKLAEELKLYGHVVMQAIIDPDNQIHIIECNSRFGGASTLSLAAGLNSFYWFLLESIGQDLAGYPFVRSQKELTMIRHPEDYIR